MTPPPPAATTRRVPVGWQLVPVEPTEAMLEAGENTFVCGYTGTPISSPGDVWQAMLAASTPDVAGVGLPSVEELCALIAIAPVEPKPNTPTKVSDWLNPRDIKCLAVLILALLARGGR